MGSVPLCPQELLCLKHLPFGKWWVSGVWVLLGVSEALGPASVALRGEEQDGGGNRLRVRDKTVSVTS